MWNCDSFVTHGPYLSALVIKGLYIKHYINAYVYFAFTFMKCVVVSQYLELSHSVSMLVWQSVWLYMFRNCRSCYVATTSAQWTRPPSWQLTSSVSASRTTSPNCRASRMFSPLFLLFRYHVVNDVRGRQIYNFGNGGGVSQSVATVESVEECGNYWYHIFIIIAYCTGQQPWTVIKHIKYNVN